MRKHLVTIVLTSLVILLGIDCVVLLARNIELTRMLDEANELIIDSYDDMFDVMDDETLVAMHLAHEYEDYDCDIELDRMDDDEYIYYTAYEDGKIIHGGCINREYYKNYYKRRLVQQTKVEL